MNNKSKGKYQLSDSTTVPRALVKPKVNTETQLLCFYFEDNYFGFASKLTSVR